MNYRRWSRVVEGLLVALVAATHAALLLAGSRLDQTDTGYLAASVLPLCQLTLLLVWAVLGPGRAWMRATALPVLLVLAGIAWARLWDGRPGNVTESHGIQLVVTGILAGCGLLALRAGGLALHRPSAPAGRDERPAQFSIAGLLVLTTLVAVTIGGLEALRPILRNDVESLSPAGRYVLDTVEDVVRPEMIRTLVISAAIAGSAVAAAWCILRPRAIWFRLAMLALGMPLLAWYLAHLAGNTDTLLRERAWSLTVAFAAVALAMAYSLWPLRVLGYRLKPRVARRAMPSPSPPARSDVVSKRAKTGEPIPV